MPAAHYRLGTRGKERTAPTACGTPGFSTVDPDQVTCPPCLAHPACIQALRELENVIEMLAYPKEDHPCLLNRPKH